MRINRLLLKCHTMSYPNNGPCNSSQAGPSWAAATRTSKDTPEGPTIGPKTPPAALAASHCAAQILQILGSRVCCRCPLASDKGWVFGPLIVRGAIEKEQHWRNYGPLFEGAPPPQKKKKKRKKKLIQRACTSSLRVHPSQWPTCSTSSSPTDQIIPFAFAPIWSCKFHFSSKHHVQRHLPQLSLVRLQTPIGSSVSSSCGFFGVIRSTLTSIWYAIAGIYMAIPRNPQHTVPWYHLDSFSDFSSYWSPMYATSTVKTVNS